jgi:hypothetical protein
LVFALTVPESVSPGTTNVEVVQVAGCPDHVEKLYSVPPEMNDAGAYKVTDVPSVTVAVYSVLPEYVPVMVAPSGEESTCSVQVAMTYFAVTVVFALMVPETVSPVTTVVEVVQVPGHPDHVEKLYCVPPERNVAGAVKVTDVPSVTVAV